jgi:propionyl-CoA carboxylase alpha chain
MGDESIEVRYVANPGAHFEVECGGESSTARVFAAGEELMDLEIDTVRRRFRVARSDDRIFLSGPLGGAEMVIVPRFPSRRRDDAVGGCLAPMPGIVRQVLVAVGDRVEAGAVMVILEAMKMEHPLVAYAPGVVKEVRVAVGQMVDPDAVMVVVEPEE